jgi:hypothetical protein
MSVGALALLDETPRDRAAMDAGELAQDRSHWNAALRRLFEGTLQFVSAASGLTGKARVDKRLAAGVRICSRRRTTQAQPQCKRCNYSKKYPLHGSSLMLIVSTVRFGVPARLPQRAGEVK